MSNLAVHAIPLTLRLCVGIAPRILAPAPGRSGPGRTIEIDLGVAAWRDGHRRYFVTAAGIGLDAAVARRARACRGPGTVPYLLAVLAALGDHAPFAASVSLDGAVVSTGPFAAVVVANGAHYGGGMKIAPAANPADGLLDLVTLGNVGRIELLRWLPAVYRGAHLVHPKVTARTGREIDIDAAPGLPMHLDGEPVPSPPVRIGVSARALRLRR